MIFGQRSQFATLFELDDDFDGPWLFGKFCYWIDGVSIGNYALGTSLRDILVCLEAVIKFNGKRTDVELFASSTEHAYFSIDASTFGLAVGDHCIDISFCSNVDNPDRFNISPGVDVFDQYKIFLIDDGLSLSRIIYRNLKTREITEVRIPVGVVDDILVKTVDELQRYLNKQLPR